MISSRFGILLSQFSLGVRKDKTILRSYSQVTRDVSSEVSGVTELINSIVIKIRIAKLMGKSTEPNRDASCDLECKLAETHHFSEW